MAPFTDTLQLEDLRRHAKSELHTNLLREMLGPAAGSEDKSDEATDTCVPTPAQIRLAVEILRRPRSGLTGEYSAKCELARRADSVNFPLGRSGPHEFARIISAITKALRNEDRRLVSQCVAAGWAEEPHV